MISRVKAEFIGGDGKMYHSHDGLAPHTHEPLESPGFFSRRAQPLTTRDYTERAFSVGIGGPVGTGYMCTDQAFISMVASVSSLVNATNLAVGT
jgi:urease accessory protein